MRFARAALITTFGLLSLCGSAAAQAPAETTLVEVGGHKLNVRVSGSAKPGVPTVVFESGLGSPIDAGSPYHPILQQRRALSSTSARALGHPSQVRNLARSGRS